MMKKMGILIVTLMICMNMFPVNAEEGQEIIWEKRNWYIPRNATYSTPLLLEPYAPHEISYQIGAVNTSIIEPLITIELISDEGSFEMRVFYDTLNRSSSYTTRTSQYQLRVENKGHVDTILNLTIRQTGEPIPPTTTLPNLTQSIVLPLVLLSSLSLIIAISGIYMYKFRLERYSNPDLAKRSTITNSRFAAFYVALLVLLVPQTFFLIPNLWEPLVFIVVGALWRYAPSANPSFTFGFAGEQFAVLLGLIFSYEIYRYYEGRTNRTEVVFIGLLRPIWNCLHAILTQSMMIDVPSAHFVLKSGPIPIVLLAGLAMIYLLPPPRDPQIWEANIS
jgi:hypothetical protein